MRRTRSNSVADMSKRSLRSTQNDEFYEIPTLFRIRSPRAAPEPKVLEKSPTRRSLRLSIGEEFDSKDEVAKARKRRFQTSLDDKVTMNGGRKKRSNVKEEYNLKSLKVLRADDEDSSNGLSQMENGVQTRTRRRHDITEINGNDHCTPNKKEVKSPRTVNTSNLSPAPKSPRNELSNLTSQIDKYTNFSPRKTRNSPRCMKQSPAQNCSKFRSSNETISDSGKLIASPKFNISIEDKSSTCKKDIDDQNNCECHSDPCTKISSNYKNKTCEHCGKLQSSSPRKNGLISNGSIDKSELESSPRSLRSSTHATTASSISTLKCAGSPMAAEEASDKVLSKSIEDGSISGHLRRSRRRSDVYHIATDTDGNIFDEKHVDKNSKEDIAKAESDDANSVCVEKNSVQRLLSADSVNKIKNSFSENNQNETSIINNSLPNRTNEKVDVISDTQSDHGIRDLKRSGSPSVFDEISCGDFDFISDNESDYSSYNRKKRKMNLRSSGVRCDPNFYTLSLDLLIKRPHRRSNLLSDWAESGPKPENGQTMEGDEQQHQKKDSEPISNAVENSTKVQVDNSLKTSSTSSFTPTITTPTTTPTLSTTTKDIISARTNIQSLFTVKQDSTIGFIKINNNANRSRSSSPCSSSSSTPRRGPTATVLHKLPSGRPRGPRGLSNTKLDRSPSIKIVAKDPSEPPPLFTEEPPSGPDVYYFESDHVALKHNRDYHGLLRTVSILESQRYRCLTDIKTLEKGRTEALDEPIKFVEKLQKKVDLGFPLLQNVPELPDIDWAKYSSVYGTFDQVFKKDVLASPKKIVTRKVKINFQTGVPMQKTEDSTKVIKRGSQANRSQSFRVAWTVEEQRRLEELLLKYPSEEIEFNRYRKIAAELENRTAMQVQSRVQKYFIKLAKAGLPIPGHMPRIEKIPKAGWRNFKRARSHPHQQLTKMSTFFPRFHVPVRMTDDQQSYYDNNNNDDEDGWTVDKDQVSDEEDVPQEMRFSDEYLEILRLKRIRRERLRVFDNNGQQPLAQHVGYECDMCNSDPIQGVRYHCIDCPTDQCVDLCQSCIRLQGQFETETHRTTHRMEPVYKSETFVDDDYLKFVSRSGDYNYLDPNFLPPKT